MTDKERENTVIAEEFSDEAIQWGILQHSRLTSGSLRKLVMTDAVVLFGITAFLFSET